jgi:hypothetical protein
MITINNHLKEKGWVCTDPDSLQFRYNNDDGTFMFMEFDRHEWPEVFAQIERHEINESVDLHPRYWISDTIDLKEYSAEDQEHFTKPYGYTWKPGGFLDETGEFISDDIIAECIFEQENGLY